MVPGSTEMYSRQNEADPHLTYDKLYPEDGGAEARKSVKLSVSATYYPIVKLY
jgi:hypothetical protein